MSDQDDESYLIVPLIFNMPAANIAAIRQCIHNVTLPTWVGRPPVNLGEASHGKLEGHDYLVLFSFILPLVVPEFWHRPERSEAEQVHLQSFEDLVVCTNIVCSFKTSNADADLYTLRYKGISAISTQTLPLLGPEGRMTTTRCTTVIFSSIGGPLPALSEFPGKHLIGCCKTSIQTTNFVR